MADKLIGEAEIKSEIMEKIEEAVDEYFASYKEKSGNGKVVPTIHEIEGLVTDLKSKTREIYLKMISDSLTNTDESELIASKKENSEKRG